MLLPGFLGGLVLYNPERSSLINIELHINLYLFYTVGILIQSVHHKCSDIKKKLNSNIFVLHSNKISGFASVASMHLLDGTEMYISYSYTLSILNLANDPSAQSLDHVLSYLILYNNLHISHHSNHKIQSSKEIVRVNCFYRFRKGHN